MKFIDDILLSVIEEEYGYRGRDFAKNKGTFGKLLMLFSREIEPASRFAYFIALLGLFVLAVTFVAVVLSFNLFLWFFFFILLSSFFLIIRGVDIGEATETKSKYVPKMAGWYLANRKSFWGKNILCFVRISGEKNFLKVEDAHDFDDPYSPGWEFSYKKNVFHLIEFIGRVNMENMNFSHKNSPSIDDSFVFIGGEHVKLAHVRGISPSMRLHIFNSDSRCHVDFISQDITRENVMSFLEETKENVDAEG